MSSSTSDIEGGKTGDRPAPRPGGTLTPKVLRFCALVLSGAPYHFAYREAYNRKDRDKESAAEEGFRILQRPIVKWHMAEMVKASRGKTLLTLNERLQILADIAQDTKAKASDRVSAIAAYSKIGGDTAPERHEHTVAGPDGRPISVAMTGAIGISRIPVQERIRLMRASAPTIPIPQQ